jgi:hypothetical protein
MSYRDDFKRLEDPAGIDGAQPPPGASGAATVALNPSGG